MVRQIVVVGAGPAGMRCAERLALAGPTISVTLVGGEAAHPYNRVALSQYLAGDIVVESLVTHAPDQLAERLIAWRPDTRVISIDRADHTIEMSDGGRLSYDALVLATGAQAVRLPLPGGDRPHVLMYRTLSDVQRMLAKAARGGAAVVIGGGLLGLEAAAGLARRGMRVTVLHAVDRLMERQLDLRAASLLAERLAKQGIAVITDAKTVAIEADAVVLADGTHIACHEDSDIVVMAVGIRPDTALARGAGLAVERGILVDDQMRTDDLAIWAIGECAQHAGQCVGLVAPSFAQAEVASAVILGSGGRYVPVSDATALKVAGAGVWSAGETDGPDPIVLDDGEAGQYRRLTMRDGRLVGAMLYGETGDAPWYLGLIKNGRPVGSARDALPFGPAFMPAGWDQ